MKRTPLTRKKPMKRGPWSREKKPRKGLRQVSDRRKRELREYAERRKSFLAMPENQFCPVAKEGFIAYWNRKYPTTDIHHKAGREGKLLNDERYWLAVSRAGHTWIHENPNAARERGWLI